MSAILITYRLQNLTAHTRFENHFKTFKDWAKLSDTSYVVWAESTEIDSINNQLQKWMANEDRLVITRLQKPFAGRMPSDVAEWLKKYLE